MCASKPLRGKMVAVQKITESRKIQVYGIGDMTKDLLRIYFENKRSGCTEVIDIRVYHEDDCALVEVPDNACKCIML